MNTHKSLQRNVSTSAGRKNRNTGDYAIYGIAKRAAKKVVSRNKRTATNDLYEKFNTNNEDRYICRPVSARATTTEDVSHVTSGRSRTELACY